MFLSGLSAKRSATQKCEHWIGRNIAIEVAAIYTGCLEELLLGVFFTITCAMLRVLTYLII